MYLPFCTSPGSSWMSTADAAAFHFTQSVVFCHFPPLINSNRISGSIDRARSRLRVERPSATHHKLSITRELLHLSFGLTLPESSFASHLFSAPWPPSLSSHYSDPLKCPSVQTKHAIHIQMLAFSYAAAPRINCSGAQFASLHRHSHLWHFE